MKTTKLFKTNYLKIISLLIMQLFFINIQASVSNTDQLARVTLELKKVTLKTVFNQIENQTDFTFFYENDIVNSNKKVSVNANNISVDKVLKQVLSGTGVVFKIIDKQIVITKKPVNTSQGQINKGVNKSSAVVKSITGVVTSTDGLPLPGVSIIIKGSQKGTETDFDGNYSIDADIGDVLEFSSIGFKTIEVIVASDSAINVQLEEDIAALNEVVLIGYGSAKKSDVTGALGVLNDKELNKFPVADAASVIQGRVAGVSVQSDGGAPGAGQLVTIRGASTLSDRGALYVIDGLFAGSLNAINPADIESITVLKDASALAIYGSRAANGVILVTTKKGKKGKLGVDIEQSYGFQKVINKLPWANATEYRDIVNAGYANEGNTAPTGLNADFDPTINSDIQSASLRTAPISNTSVRLYGGSESLTYNLSANVFDREGIVRESDFSRKTLRSNATFAKGKFKLQNTLGLSNRVINANPYFNRERDLLPVIPIRDANGQFTGRVPSGNFNADGSPIFKDFGVPNVINSLGLATIEDRTVTDNQFTGNVVGSYEFLKGLTYKLNLGLTYGVNNNFRFSPEYEFTSASSGRRDINELRELNRVNQTTLIENTLNYKNTFDKHSVDVVVGVTEEIFNSRTLGGVGRNFANENTRVLSAADDRAQFLSEDITTVLQSYLGRLNYSYDDRYYATASLRRDSSSLFGEGNKSNNYPSFALAWNLSNEAFMEDFSAIEDIKLRGSYGEIGSNNVTAYQLTAVINPQATAIFGDGDGTRQIGSAITDAVNPDLVWETTTQTDFGIEFTALQKKLNVTMDYFNKESEDVVVPLQPGLLLGRTGRDIDTNIGNITNKGFELSAGYTDSVGDLNFSVSGNVTFLDNEVTKVGVSDEAFIASGSISSNTTNTTRTQRGQPVSSFYGYIVDGIYQTQAEADAAAPNVNGAPSAGDFRFRDIDGDGDVDSEDQTFIGSPIPTVEYGLNINLDYKNWDMTLFFNGVGGNEIINGTKYRGFFDQEGNYFRDALNAWTPTNTNTNIPRTTINDPNDNRRASSFYVEDGSYFRLRNIQLGYSIPKTVLESIKVNRVRIYVSAQNLFTITDYTGYYPEVGRNGRNGGNPRLLSSGVDESAYPSARTFQGGIQVSF